MDIFRRRLAPGARLGIVVKADAYGHGMAACARIFEKAGADWLIVNDVDEALELRAAAIDTPLYICGPVLPERAQDVVACGARVVVYDTELVDALHGAGRGEGSPVPVHLKIETGNHRQGVPVEDAMALAGRIRGLDGVRLEGIATHFADVEDTTDHQFARQQLQAFDTARSALTDGRAPLMVHSANSAATILWPEAHGDLVRVGIAAYGLWPSTETYATAIQAHAQESGGFVPQLEPVLSWVTRIAQLKDVPRGGFIGYGRTYRATHPMRIAVLPLGYYEGYDRRLSNVGHVLCGGERAPIRGRVCMNMTMVDVTHAPDVKTGDRVTLLGHDGDEQVSAEALAGWMGTINYEVVSRIHPRFRRVVV